MVVEIEHSLLPPPLALGLKGCLGLSCIALLSLGQHAKAFQMQRPS